MSSTPIAPPYRRDHLIVFLDLRPDLQALRFLVELLLRFGLVV
jgi:hypothetical protein